MNTVTRLIKGEPVALSGIITAAIGLAVTLGADEKIMGALGVLIGAVITFIVRSGVNTVAKTVAVTTAAAHKAAVTTAENLTDETVGAHGTTTGSAVGIVADATQAAVMDTLRDAGFSRKDRLAAA